MPQVTTLSRVHARSITGLYLLTRETADTEALLADVERVLKAGVRVLQYRDKSADSVRRLAQARALRGLCGRFGVTLIINDDVDLALAVAADGVHLGEDDAPIAAARLRLGADRIIGVSCYNGLARAERAVAEGADYVAFGAFFSSATKPQARAATPQLLRDARKLHVPIVAIGGIDAGNGGALIEAGADALAVLGSVWDASDPGRAAQAMAALFLESGMTS
jgi:thiamine-phosphate pyrophosphorylase